MVAFWISALVVDERSDMDLALGSVGELQDAFLQGEQSVVTTPADVVSGMDVGAALADDDVADADFFAGETLHAKALGFGIATVAR